MNFVFTCGRFDILHAGHVKLFQYCATKGLPVLVGINSDESCKRIGKPAIIGQTDRFILVSSIKFVSIALVFDDTDARDFINSMPTKPELWIIGDDHKNEDFSSVSCKVEFFPRDGNSSSKIKEKIHGN